MQRRWEKFWNLVGREHHGSTILGGIVVGLVVVIVGGLILSWVQNRLNRPADPPHPLGPPVTGPHVDLPPPPPIDFQGLLGKKRGGKEVNDVLSILGMAEENSLSLGGKELCFRNRGIDFRFDSSDVLDTIAWFAGYPGDVHRGYDGKLGNLPLGLSFTQGRSEVREQIRIAVKNPIPPDWNVGECDKYEVGKAYRLFLCYTEYLGKKRLREIDMGRPEDFSKQHVALLRP